MQALIWNKSQGTAEGRKDTSSEMLSLVSSGKFATFMNA